MTAARDAWPSEFPLDGEMRVARGLPVWSLPVEVDGCSGLVEGRTTGGRRSCAAPSCGGWFIGVNWETGSRCSSAPVVGSTTRTRDVCG